MRSRSYPVTKKDALVFEGRLEAKVCMCGDHLIKQKGSLITFQIEDEWDDNNNLLIDL